MSTQENESIQSNSESDKLAPKANESVPGEAIASDANEATSRLSKLPKKRKKTTKKASEKITKPVEGNRIVAVRGLFTWILVLCNIIVFVVMIKRYGMGTMLQPNPSILLKMGADYGPLVASGERWRMVSCMFVHVGIIHLVLNMIALSDVGKLLEKLYGSQKFLIIYFLSGITGSLTSLLWHPTVVSAGASAAVFGVIGAEFIYVWVHHKYFTAAAIHAHYGAFAMLVAYSLIAEYLNIHLDHAAHIGGFACGVLAGFALIPRVMSNIRWQLEDIPRLALLLLGLGGMGELTRQHLAAMPAESMSQVSVHSKFSNKSRHSKINHPVNANTHL